LSNRQIKDRHPYFVDSSLYCCVLEQDFKISFSGRVVATFVGTLEADKIQIFIVTRQPLLARNIIHEEHAETGKPFAIYWTTS